MRLALPRLPSRAHAAALLALGSAFGLVFVATWLAALPLGAFVLACAIAPYFPTWSFFLPTSVHGPRHRAEVALTFDDGPDPRTHGPLLELLAREGVPVTFFVVGKQAASQPALVLDAVAAGHQIGNHSQSHDPFLMLRSIARLRREVLDCQEVLAGLGVLPLTFRPPVGITNPRLLPVLKSAGLRCVAFSCRPLDFANRRLNRLADRVLRRVRPGDIVLLHDILPPEVPVETWLSEVERILVGLRHQRLMVVPLSRLLGVPVMEQREVSAGSAMPAPPSLPRALAAPAPAPVAGWVAALQAAFALGYPLLVLAGVTWLGARQAALLLLLALGVARARTLRRDLGSARGTLGLWAAVAVLLALSALLDDTRYMLAYPALVNAVLLGQFAWSLRSGPPMAERFARMQDADLSAAEVRYCRCVTETWCAFFVLNGSLAGVLAVAAPRTWWALYTGGVSYGLVGFLFATEYLVRKARFGRFGKNPIDRLLERVLGQSAAP